MSWTWLIQFKIQERRNTTLELWDVRSNHPVKQTLSTSLGINFPKANTSLYVCECLTIHYDRCSTGAFP